MLRSITLPPSHQMKGGTGAEFSVQNKQIAMRGSIWDATQCASTQNSIMKCTQHPDPETRLPTINAQSPSVINVSQDSEGTSLNTGKGRLYLGVSLKIKYFCCWKTFCCSSLIYCQKFDSSTEVLLKAAIIPNWLNRIGDVGLDHMHLGRWRRPI